MQSEMIKVRLSCAVEKSKYVFHKPRLAGGIPSAQDEDIDRILTPSPTGPKRQKWQLTNLRNSIPDSIAQQLSQQQLQLFADQNKDVPKHYEDQLDQVHTAERSIQELSELHST